ncbi:MAG TPA: hypothetical protein VF796_10825 [Humisphaera sp.]
MPRSTRFPTTLTVLAALWATTASPAARAAEIRVDAAQPAGRIRPLHGGNGGPVPAGGMLDLTAQQKALGLPFLRLHDCDWPTARAVDVHTIFPDFTADPDDPKAYRFAGTDAYLKAVLATGAKVVYRLGESIEHTKVKEHVHPPADPKKWARVCANVVAHYNDGWADGFRHGIEYWEVWNEPENRPACWTGTDEQYLDLYEATATAIKARFPAVKVGGPSLGEIGKFRPDGSFAPSPLMAAFLARCRDRKLPLDFFSFHGYSADPGVFVRKAKAVRAALNTAGFEKAEVHFNEWNFLPDNNWGPVLPSGQGPARDRFHARQAGPEGAAFASCVLAELQDAPVDVSNFYRADAGLFGLFSQHGTPNKVYHAFKAFRGLLDTPDRVAVTGTEPGKLAALAGRAADGSAVAVFVSNYRAAGKRVTVRVDHLPWEGSTAAEVFVVDEKRDLEKASSLRLEPGVATVEVDLPAPAVCLVRLKRG